jgi:hypothetical protein
MCGCYVKERLKKQVGSMHELAVHPSVVHAATIWAAQGKKEGSVVGFKLTWDAVGSVLWPYSGPSWHLPSKGL